MVIDNNVVHGLTLTILSIFTQREQHVMYVSTEDNTIKKLSVLPRTMVTCVLEIWKPLADPADKILSMYFLQQMVSCLFLDRDTRNKYLSLSRLLFKLTFEKFTYAFLHLFTQDSLYISTKNEVMRIPSQHCKRHKSKQACVNAMDPYCGWNELKEQCSPPPEKNPLISYWHQNAASCPIFTHPGMVYR